MQARTLFLYALLVAGPAAAQTQQPAPKGPELVDRIIAIVGDSVIFDSEIQERLQIMEQQGQKVPRDDSTALKKLKRDLIEEMVERLVLLQFAQRDTTLQLNDTQINAQVENIINQRRQQMGGETQLQAALRQQRMSMQSWREILTQEVRSQSLIQQFMGKLSRDRKPPPITEQTLKAEFERAKAAGRLPPRQASIAFSHIVLPPRASDAARAVARAKADSIMGLIRAGEDFVALAKRFTEEPGGQERGGDLGWSRPEGTFVKEFADAVSIMRPGEVVGPVETSFGFHLIKLEKVRGAEKQVRHILIMPETADSDSTQLLERGREIAAKIKAGADIDSLAKVVGSSEQRTSVEIQRDRLQQISPAYAENLANARKGDVVGPFLVQDPTGRPSAAIVRVDHIREAGEQTWDDPAVRAIFRSQIEQQRLVNELMEELRRRTHVEIRL